MTRKSIVTARYALAALALFGFVLMWSPGRSQVMNAVVPPGGCGSLNYPAGGSAQPVTQTTGGQQCASTTVVPTYYPNITPYTSPVTVTSSATLMASSTTARGAITVSVEGANAMRCGQSSSVVFAGGSETASGVLIGGTGNPASWTWVSYIGAIYCITSSSSSAAGVSATQ